MITVEYGKAGTLDREVIDEYLQTLPKGGVVLNLGCGPNLPVLHNLARAMYRYCFNSLLILADLEIGSIQAHIFVPGPKKVEVVRANAGSASETLGVGTIDLILALGLFGALSQSTAPRNRNSTAVVLRECKQLLKDGGHLIVGNSLDRQPEKPFSRAVRQAGLEVTHSHISETVLGAESPNEKRYLLVCQKRLRKANHIV